MSTQSEENYCGLSQRKICISTGILEIIINFSFIVCAFIFVHYSILISAVILLVIILPIIPMLFGAIKQKSDLFFPYILIKFIIICAALVSLVICIFLIIIYEAITMSIIEKEFDTDVCNFMAIYFILPMGILFILNAVPLLIVKNYYRELNENKHLEMTRNFNNAELFQVEQQQLQQQDQQDPQREEKLRV